MSIWAWILIAVAAGAAVLLLGALVFRQQRTRRLQRRFGPEYDRALERRGSRRGGEAELGSRVKRREQLEIQPLTPDARAEYTASWERVQREFVDDPPRAVAAADGLVNAVMSEEGYPMGDFDERAGDISVDHPQVVERYRSAHGIAEKSRQDRATTEDLRQALKHYRALFEELLEPAQDEPISRDRAETGAVETNGRTVHR
jgi:hypothetical protein